MARRTLLKRIATLVAGVLLSSQLAIAAHACPKGLGGSHADAPDAVSQQAAATGFNVDSTAAQMPGCDGSMGKPDLGSSNLCAEHCKQGQQSDRASLGLAVPAPLLNALYEASPVPEPARGQPPLGAWLSALVEASPPHAIAHCVLRI